MSLKESLNQAVKNAMKAKESDRLRVLRSVQAAIKQIEIDKQVVLDDVAIIEVLQKQAKQRQESLTIYESNERPDLANKERFELEVIADYLPKPFDENELASFVQDIIKKTGASTMADMGKVMATAKSEAAGRADPALLSQIIKRSLT